MERPLGELRLCAVLMDGTPFKDRQMIVALGIGCVGRKTVLGLREGATENAAVVGALLSDLLARGLGFTTPRLYVLDGGKSLHTAVRRHTGESAFIQRCQVHKKRNLVDPLQNIRPMFEENCKAPIRWPSMRMPNEHWSGRSTN
jgi:putative transposase